MAKFFAHFNRVNMQRNNPNVWTVHYKGKCIQGTGIVFEVPTYTQFKPAARQPRATIRGSCTGVARNPNGLVTVF